jgi:ribonuclease-3
MKELESILNVSFQNKKWLQRALTHSSYANEHNCESNERLEFMGDAVLDVMMSDYLFQTYPEKDEGFLTKTRAKFVCESALHHYALSCHLDRFILLGKGEEKSGGRKRPSLLADAFEALLGAIYMDQGIEECWKVFHSVIKPALYDSEEEEFVDYKSILQELVQSDKRTLNYRIDKEFGPSHNKTFEASVYMDDILMGKGIGKSKKEAEQKAAAKALEKLA